MDEQKSTCGCACKETLLFAVIAFLCGVIAGFFLAPIKEGLTIGCENGNNNNVTNTECMNHSTEEED